MQKMSKNKYENKSSKVEKNKTRLKFGKLETKPKFEIQWLG